MCEVELFLGKHLKLICYFFFFFCRPPLAMARYAPQMPLPTMAPTNTTTSSSSPPRQDPDNGKFYLKQKNDNNPFLINKLLIVCFCHLKN